MRGLWKNLNFSFIAHANGTKSILFSNLIVNNAHFNIITCYFSVKIRISWVIEHHLEKFAINIRIIYWACIIYMATNTVYWWIIFCTILNIFWIIYAFTITLTQTIKRTSTLIANSRNKSWNFTIRRNLTLINAFEIIGSYIFVCTLVAKTCATQRNQTSKV